MNKYGVRAKAHWEKYLPARTAALEDPQEFFTNLGEQVSDLVTATVEDLEVQHAQQIKEADYLTRVGLLTTLQQQAEEIALAELVLLPSESPEEWADPEMEYLEERARVMNYEGMPVDRDHRLWQMMEDDSVSLLEFRAAAEKWTQEQEAIIRKKVAARRPDLVL